MVVHYEGLERLNNSGEAQLKKVKWDEISRWNQREKRKAGPETIPGPDLIMNGTSLKVYPFFSHK